MRSVKSAAAHRSKGLYALKSQMKMLIDRQHSCLSWKAIAGILLLAQSMSGRGLYDGIATTISPSDRSLQSTFAVFLVVSAEELNDGPHCNGNPPRGIFRIHEQLRGFVPKERVELVWSTRSEEKDHVPWSQEMPSAWRRYYRGRPGTSEWQQIPLPPPKIGEKIIVFAKTAPRPLSESAQTTKGLDHIREIWKGIAKSKNTPYLIVSKAFAYNQSNRQTVLDDMGPTDRNPRIQAVLVRLLLGCTPLSLVVFALAFGISHRRRVLLWASVIAIAPLSFLLWWFVETGILTGGIRIDLFIVLPFLCVNVVMAVVAAVTMLIHTRKHKREPITGG